RHPDLKVRWTTSLEQCRARALNPNTVHDYFKTLDGVIQKYDIIPENSWNMDEKGVQLGIGQRIAAFVDRDATSVYQVENGNRELVTIIEAICADGTALHPSVIYQGKRRDLEWARNNPCKASLSFSPKGWTDQDLGLKWLQQDFEPATAAKNPTAGYRLLILDGHNSHCTYKFCKFAADHKIIIVCLPSHTTHVLQPCDVGVFGPLARCWKAEVNATSAQLITINKHNMLEYYDRARRRAFKPSTICSAFAKTGIYPFNPDVIPVTAFDPSLLTTTKAALPLGPVRP
ncbi:DDE-domain-containing protein, partial [Neolentinus lepideus HHB14362 ss-1]